MVKYFFPLNTPTYSFAFHVSLWDDIKIQIFIIVDFKHREGAQLVVFETLKIILFGLMLFLLCRSYSQFCGPMFFIFFRCSGFGPRPQLKSNEPGIWPVENQMVTVFHETGSEGLNRKAKWIINIRLKILTVRPKQMAENLYLVYSNYPAMVAWT